MNNTNVLNKTDDKIYMKIHLLFIVIVVFMLNENLLWAQKEIYGQLNTQNWLELKRDFLEQYLLNTERPQGISNPNLKTYKNNFIYTNETHSNIEIDIESLVQDYQEQINKGERSGPISSFGYYPDNYNRGRHMLIYDLEGHPDPTSYLKVLFGTIKRIHGEEPSDSDPQKTAKMRAKANDMKDFLNVMNFSYEQESQYRVRRLGYLEDAQAQVQMEFKIAFCKTDDVTGVEMFQHAFETIQKVDPNFQMPERFKECVKVAKPKSGQLTETAPHGGDYASIPRTQETCPPASQEGSNTQNIENLARSTATSLGVNWMLSAISSEFPNMNVGEAETQCGEGIFNCTAGYVYRGSQKCQNVRRQICEHPPQEIVDLYNSLRPRSESSSQRSNTSTSGTRQWSSEHRDFLREVSRSAGHR